MKRDLFAPIRNLLSLPSHKELPYLCFLMKRVLFAPIRNLVSLPSRKELPYLCLLNEEGPIRSH